MTKKDINSILTTGSLKQKLLIVAENRARERYVSEHPDLKDREPLLTQRELDTIQKSVKTDREIALWNKWIDYDRLVINALINLQGLVYEVQKNYSNLRGYILTWNAIENAEFMANKLLHQTKDPEERKRIAEYGIGRGLVGYLFTDTTIDEEGYIDIKVDVRQQVTKVKRLSFVDIINNVKEEATQSLIKFLSCSQALTDYFEETGFNVKTYKDFLKVYNSQVRTPIIGYEKYEGITTGDPESRLNKLRASYQVTPKIGELKINQETYNYFKNKILSND